MHVWQAQLPPPLAHASHRSHQGGNGSGLGIHQCLPKRRCDAADKPEKSTVSQRATKCLNVGTQTTIPRSSPKNSCQHRQVINPPLAQCFKAPKLISHTKVHVESAVQPHQHRTRAPEAHAPLQTLSRTKPSTQVSREVQRGQAPQKPAGYTLSLPFLSMSRLGRKASIS